MIPLSLFFSCQQMEAAQGTCNPEPPVHGEIRIERISCSDEKIPESSGRIGDWRMENAFSRFHVRANDEALSMPNAAGGTLSAAAPWEEKDGIIELIPLWNGKHLDNAIVTANGNGIDVIGNVGNEEKTYSFKIDGFENSIAVKGTSQWKLTLKAGATLSGKIVSLKNLPYVYGFSDPPEDLGGALLFDKLEKIHIGEWSSIHKSLDEDSLKLEFETESDWVIVLDGEEQLGKFPVSDGLFSAWVPQSADLLQAQNNDCPPGEEVPIDEIPLAGECRKIRVRATDQNNNPIPFALKKNSRWVPIPKEGSAVMIELETEEISLNAGIGYEQKAVSINTSEEYSVIIPRTAPDNLLVFSDILAHPDPKERRTDKEILQESAAMGAQTVLLKSTGIPAAEEPDPGTHWNLLVQGIRTLQNTEEGAWSSAWPWIGNGRTNPLKAPEADIHRSLMHAHGEGRHSMVNFQWVDEAGPIHTWPVVPDHIWISGPEDLHRYYQMLDDKMPMAPLGPKVWAQNLDTSCRSMASILSELNAQHVTVGNGPWLSIEIDGAKAGDLLDSDEELKTVLVKFASPSWLQTNSLRLLGPENQTIAEWEIEEQSGEFLIEIEKKSWVLAEITGDEMVASPVNGTSWAITAPIWLD